MMRNLKQHHRDPSLARLARNDIKKGVIPSSCRSYSFFFVRATGRSPLHLVYDVILKGRRDRSVLRRGAQAGKIILHLRPCASTCWIQKELSSYSYLEPLSLNEIPKLFEVVSIWGLEGP
jgi:hypothetical protein